MPSFTENNQLQDLLRFVTCLDAIPPLGIMPEPTLAFDLTEDEENIHTRGVPYANTCINCLHVPILSSYELFKERMLLALELGLSFTDR